MLEEAGKLLEQIIAGRLVRHLSQIGPQLHPEQYGFREGQSTVDAIKSVRSLAEAATKEGVWLAVSLDIKSAFNALPWKEEALEKFKLPMHLWQAVHAYLSDKRLAYVDRDEVHVRRSVMRGFPQGLVLGPLLWDIGCSGLLSSMGARSSAIRRHVSPLEHIYLEEEWHVFHDPKVSQSSVRERKV